MNLGIGFARFLKVLGPVVLIFWARENTLENKAIFGDVTDPEFGIW